MKRFICALILCSLASLVTSPVVVAETETVVDPVLDDAGVDEGPAEADVDAPPEHGPLELLNTEVPPSSKQTLRWGSGQSFAGMRTEVPVLVANGHEAGPVLCVIAAIHGDELNGIEMVRRVMEDLDPSTLKGAVIGVPIVNLYGFQRGSRYLPDRRDLNRFFPGNPDGSSASRIAHAFFDQIVRLCTAVVDIHTGSFHRTNLTQLRADLSNEAVVDLTKGFGGLSVLDGPGSIGTLRRAATEGGIPSVTLEAGEPMRLQESHVQAGVRGINSLLSHLGMIDKARFWKAPQPVFYESIWVRSNRGGILLSRVKLGEQVRAGTVLGTITDPVTNVRSEIVSPRAGRVLGMAVNQVVMPGFAAYRIGIRRTEEEVEQAAQAASDAAATSENTPEGGESASGDSGQPVRPEPPLIDPDERPE